VEQRDVGRQLVALGRIVRAPQPIGQRLHVGRQFGGDDQRSWR
jgi:hypothetical protein